jgi:hypothetical protein
MSRRETRVLDAVGSLVDGLLDDFDIVDLLTELAEHCAQLLDVGQAGFLLADPLRQLHLMAATSEKARDLELFQLQADEYVGVLDVFRANPGLWATEQLAAASVAAKLAEIPILDLMDADLQAAVADPDSKAWPELNTLSRVQVSQAIGMLMAQLEIEPAEALVRLRAYAFATGRSATNVARDILNRRLRLEAD